MHQNSVDRSLSLKARCVTSIPQTKRVELAEKGGTYGLTARLLNVAILGAIFFSGNVYGQDTQPTKQNAESSPAATSDGEIKLLIEQLGSAKFQERESATTQLFSLGTEVLVELKQVKASDGLERFQRAQYLVTRIEKERFEKVSREFLLSRNPEEFEAMPAWDKFAEISGTSRTSRLLYLDVLESNPKILGFVAKTEMPLSAADSEKLALLILESCEQVQQQRLRLQEPTIGDLTGILWATCLLEETLPTEGNMYIMRMIGLSPFTTYMQKRGYSSSLRNMLNLWLTRVQPVFDYQLLTTSLRYDLEQSVQIARRNLSNAPDPNILRYAIHSISRYGDENDLPILAKLMNENRIISRYRAAEVPTALREPEEDSDEELSEDARFLAYNKRWIVRVKDLAFAASLMLSGKDPLEVVPSFEWEAYYGFRATSLAIPEIPNTEYDTELFEKREKAIQNWSKLQTENAKQTPKQDET